MATVYHVIQKKLEEINEPYVFKDGDVYVIDDNDTIWIWLGKDSQVEEKGVGAWLSHKMDLERRGEPAIYTITQGEEPEEFKRLLEYQVIDADTPGFLVQAELDTMEYKLYKIEADTQTNFFDKAQVKEVPLDKSSLDSDDVFVLDGNEVIFVWYGKHCNVEERVSGGKVARKIDQERHGIPLVYTIEEGSGGKGEKTFYELLEKLAQVKGPVVSVEDKREQSYRQNE